MRLQFGVLDHLDRHDFIREIQVGKECERYEPGSLRRMADTHGLRADYDRWESGKRAPDLLRPEVYTEPGVEAPVNAPAPGPKSGPGRKG